MAIDRPLDVHHELRNACRNGRWTRAERMLAAGANPSLCNPRGENAVHHLARRSRDDAHLEIWAHRLLDLGVPVHALNRDAHSALTLALTQGHVALAVALMARGAELTPEDATLARQRGGEVLAAVERQVLGRVAVEPLPPSIPRHRL